MNINFEDLAIRRFKTDDADEVSNLIIRNFMEVNIKDYGLDAVTELSKSFDSHHIIERSKYAHMYVIEYNKELVTTGSISSYWRSETESILLSIFVLPEYHGQGLGSLIIKTLENDELYKRATRIEIPASITAVDFYRKYGYDYKNNQKVLDNEGHYRLEKYKDIQ